MKISFIGLGVIGSGMAFNLAMGAGEGEYDFLVHDINEKALEKFIKAGIQTTTNILDTVDSDYLFLCLPDSETVKTVVLGKNGLIKYLKKGQAIIDFSTINYRDAKYIATICQEKGVDFLDCPISGLKEKSMEGTLTIMCGGNKETFHKIKPFLQRVGSKILYMGESGAGQLTKMINNCILNICIASFSELMPVGVKLGLDPEKLGEVLMSASGSSFASQALIPKILEGNFHHGFSLERAYKDMESMFEVIVQHQIPLPTFFGTMQSYQLALQHGQKDYYKHAMIRFFEDMLDVQVRKKEFAKK